MREFFSRTGNEREEMLLFRIKSRPLVGGLETIETSAATVATWKCMNLNLTCSQLAFLVRALFPRGISTAVNSYFTFPPSARSFANSSAPGGLYGAQATHRLEYLHAPKVPSLFVYIRTAASIILTFTTFPPYFLREQAPRRTPRITYRRGYFFEICILRCIAIRKFLSMFPDVANYSLSGAAHFVHIFVVKKRNEDAR